MKIIIGHALLNEGLAQPFGHYKENRLNPGGCQCGVLSEPLESNNQRKAWHRQHKLYVQAAIDLMDQEELETLAAELWAVRNTGPYDTQNAYIRAPFRAAAMYELLRPLDAEHPAFGDGFSRRDER